MKDLEFIDEEEVIIEPPYNIITYIDEQGDTHMATIADTNYLKYILERFPIIDNKFVEK